MDSPRLWALSGYGKTMALVSEFKMGRKRMVRARFLKVRSEMQKSESMSM